MNTKREEASKAAQETLDSEERKKIIAGAAISAHFMNATLIEPFAKSVIKDLPLFDIVESLKENIREVQAGDMASMEAILIGQAQALQTVFVSLGRKALNTSQLNQYTTFMNLALRAQSQSRATIQALVELKNPKQVAYVNQANISHGPQQVNNAINSTLHSPEVENQNPQNKLLEAQQNEWLDRGAESEAIGTDKAMATVEKEYRCTNSKR